MLIFPDWSFLAEVGDDPRILICPGCNEPVAATEREYRQHVLLCSRTTRGQKLEQEWALMFERRATKAHQRQVLRMSCALSRPWGVA
jgi:recombinational DNA repair protein (RecF pathway)